MLAHVRKLEVEWCQELAADRATAPCYLDLLEELAKDLVELDLAGWPNGLIYAGCEIHADAKSRRVPCGD